MEPDISETEHLLQQTPEADHDDIPTEKVLTRPKALGFFQALMLPGVILVSPGIDASWGL